MSDEWESKRTWAEVPEDLPFNYDLIEERDALERQLDEANQRIAELEAEIENLIEQAHHNEWK